MVEAEELILFLTSVAPSVAGKLANAVRQMLNRKGDAVDRYINLALLAIMAEQNEQLRQTLDQMRAQLDRNSEALAVILKRTEKL